MTNKERFLQLVSEEKTDTVRRNKIRIKYRWFFRLKNRLILWWLDLINF